MEPENGFTIFASAGAATAVAHATRPEVETDAPEAQETPDTEAETDDHQEETSLEAQEAYLTESGDFELDLSGMDNPDAEDWVVGATLTEDLAEISKFTSEMSLENIASRRSEMQVQGLGFDMIGDMGSPDTERTQQEEAPSFDPEPTVVDEEMAIAEMEPYAPKNKAEPDLDERDSAQQQDESSSSSPSGSQEEISLETELKLETKNDANSQDPEKEKIDFQDGPIELNPEHELEDLDLDLETENLKDEDAAKDSLPGSGLTLENDDEIKLPTDEDTPK
ncbi:MAG: hypothetical protein NPINA01_23660 [Nitrospinaceae bacterium]|nr:MAG: hypothetical protein NPINA01_23660 [Nitrospinaceae bacterium]